MEGEGGRENGRGKVGGDCGVHKLTSKGHFPSPILNLETKEDKRQKVHILQTISDFGSNLALTHTS